MIFKSGNDPIVFHMIECPEQKDVKALILGHGGVFSEDLTSNSVDLIPYEINFILKQEYNHAVYSYKFVHDSVALNCLQPLKLYEITRYPIVLHTQSLKLPYTKEEDQAMINYVREHIGNPSNITFWKVAMGKLGTGHSADSLRAHWKIIKQKIGKIEDLSKKKTNYCPQKLGNKGNSENEGVLNTINGNNKKILSLLMIIKILKMASFAIL